MLKINLQSLFKSLKSFNNWHSLALVLIFIVLFFVFLNLEPNTALKVVMTAISLFGIIFLPGKSKTEFLTILISYLLFFDLYYLFLNFQWALWQIMTLFIVGASSIFLLAHWANKDELGENYFWAYLILTNFILLEIFLSLIPWPIDPKNKAMILTTLFYTISGLINLKKQHQLIWDRILYYVIIAILLISGIVLTAQWFRGY